MALNSSTRTVTAYFSSRDKAQSAVHALKDAGFTSSQISLAIRPEYGADETNASRTGNEEGMWDKIKDFFGADSDAHGSSTRGEESGQAVQPVNGGYDYDLEGLNGSMNKLDVPDEHSKYFTQRLGQGSEGALVTVRAAQRGAEAESILENNEGDLGKTPSTIPSDTDTANLAGAQRVQLFGEVLQVHKDRVQRGEVTLRKDVITENKTFTVPVTREELVITRRAVTGQESFTATDASIGNNDEIHIPLSEERVSLEKQNVVLEEVSVGKRSVTDTQTVSSDVRHEDLVVEDSRVGK